MPNTFILTCEHAGNEIPAEYEHLFREKEEVLFTHQAIDFGALRLAKHLATELSRPLYYTTTSRLLVEANRSLENEELFSDYTKNLTANEKQALLDNYYFPHRGQVEEAVAGAIAAGQQVVHLAVHTFTPVLAGEVREADIGILYDPDHPGEEAWARHLQTVLADQNPDRKVRFNSPYPGTADGFPMYLRKIFSSGGYRGFELEINQKFFLTGEAQVWQQLVTEFTTAIKALQHQEIIL
jgi:predicted N-formylglutamate amidohydrolase